MSGITDGVDFDGIDAATAEAIEKAIESGDLDAMNALLNGADVTEIKKTESQTGEQNAASGEVDSEKSDEVDQSDVDKTDVAETDEVDEAAEDEKPVVATKDGKRIIPYEVLETTRSRASKLATENQELKNKLAEHESKSQKVNKFLATKGIDPNSISDEQVASLSDEELSQLDDLDPVVGKAIRLLSHNIASTQQVQTTQKQEPGLPPETIALRNNPDLMKWNESDPDRWDFACNVEEKLNADPKFKNASYEVRFAEAARRTKIAFGDEMPVPVKETAPQKTKQQIAEAASKKVDDAMRSSVPRSLSNLGVTPNSERSPIELLSEKDPADLLADMANMHPDKLMAMLQQIE